MVTIRMIAEKCGLTVASVSKALNNRPGVSPEKAAEVRQVAREMGYFPNAAAQTLKTNRSHNIGVLYQNEMGHELFSVMLEAIRSATERWGYDFTLLNCLSRELGGFYAHAKYRSCDGVIIVHVRAEYEDLKDLVESDIPVVSIDRVFPGRTAVVNDDVNSMREIVRFLYDLGHRRLAYIHGEPGDVARKRLAGFYRGCKEVGIEVPDSFVVSARFHEPEDSYVAAEALMSQSPRPSCILFPDDVCYLGGLDAIKSMGLSVPEDVSCFGYDGVKLTNYLSPSLATYELDAEALGRIAVEQLMNAIEEPKLFAPEVITAPGKVRPGGTVKDLRNT